MDDEPLELAREELRDASDAADRPIQTQVDSLQEGLKEEGGGERTQSEPEAKPDRIAEVASKLEALADEARSPASDRIERAREHLDDALSDRN